MKRSKTITLKINPKDFPLERVGKKLTKTQRARFYLALVSQIQDIKRHFAKHSWKLDWRFIEESVFDATFGNCLSTYLMAQVMSKTKTELVGERDGFYLKKRSYRLKKRSQRK